MDQSSLLSDLFLAYFEARKNKRSSLGEIAFEMNFEREIFRLYDEIISRTYKISPSTCFISQFPIRREIFAGAFRDRVVHHFVFKHLNPLCERFFINDSYSCRLGRGTSYGIARAEHFARSVSENYLREAYVLKLDISGYFMSMDKHILFEKIQTILDRFQYELTMERDLLMWLIETIIFNDPTNACIIKGKRNDWVGLPKSKSLFFSRKDCGLPIGNLTSQLFSNIYLHDLDTYVMYTLGIKHYGRYVDDMILFSQEKNILQNMPTVINTYLHTKLHIRLHPKKIYLQPVRHGFLFLGKVILPYHRYLKRKTKANAYKKIVFWKKVLDQKGGVLDLASQERLEACVRSYHGVFLSCKGYRLEKKIFSLLLGNNKKIPFFLERLLS